SSPFSYDCARSIVPGRKLRELLVTQRQLGFPLAFDQLELANRDDDIASADARYVVLDLDDQGNDLVARAEHLLDLADSLAFPHDVELLEIVHGQPFVDDIGTVVVELL